MPRDGVRGACPPSIIHSHQAEAKENDGVEKHQRIYRESDKIYVAPRFSDGLADPQAGPKDFYDQQNPCGFCVRSTKNGSMT